MGLSSSKSSTKPVYSKQIEGAANTVTQNYNQNAGAVQGIANSVQGLIPGLIEKYQAGNPAVKAATGYATDVLGGKYLDQGNPYLQGMIDNTNSDVANKVNGSLGTRGRTGGDIQTSLLARELAKNETGLRYGDYSAERDRMGSAASLAPGLAAADYAGISPVLAAAQAGTELPFSATNNYAQTIGGLLGQYTNTKQSPSLGALLAQMAGNAASSFAMGG
jgi:hypothetical protein